MSKIICGYEIITYINKSKAEVMNSKQNSKELKKIWIACTLYNLSEGNFRMIIQNICNNHYAFVWDDSEGKDKRKV